MQVDIALQCMHIQFNATGTIVGAGSSTDSSFFIIIIHRTINYQLSLPLVKKHMLYFP